MSENLNRLPSESLEMYESARRILREKALINARRVLRDWRDAGAKADQWINQQFREWQGDPGHICLPGRHSDTPDTADELGFSQWVDSIGSILGDEILRTPAGICIDGDWGVGKSTFMRMLFERLTSPRFINSGWLVVWLDSSLVMSPEEVLGFISERIRCLAYEQAMTALQKNPDDPRSLVLPWPSHLWGGDGDELPSPADEKHFKKKVENFVEFWKETNDYRSWTYERLKTLVRDVRFGALGGHGLERIVLMVDDLDRCEPDVVWNFFAAHRVLLQQYGIIFVYAMDSDRIAEAVGMRLAVSGRHSMIRTPSGIAVMPIERGERFLEKFFTHKIRPPQATRETLDAWFGKLVGVQNKPENIGEALYYGLCGNPRMIKYIANICGSLLDHMTSAFSSTDPAALWGRFIEEFGVEESMKLLCKTVVFAFGWGPAFEAIRVKATRFRSAEASVLTSGMIPCLWGYERWMSPIDRGLKALLTSRPRFPSEESLCRDLIEAVDPYLSQAWEMHRHLGVPSSESEAARIHRPGETIDKEKAIIASQSDISKTEEKISHWIEGARLPQPIRAHLETTPIPVVADLFRRKGFDPSHRSLIDRAHELETIDRSAGHYLVCAALAKPDLSEEIFAYALNVIDSIAEQTFVLEVYAFGAQRFPDSPEIQVGYFGSLLSLAKNPEDVQKAMDLFYKHFDTSPENLTETSINTTSNADKAWLQVICNEAKAADMLEEALKIFKVAGKTTDGKSAFVYRNLARLLNATEQVELAVAVHLAALFMDESDTQAADDLATGISRSELEVLIPYRGHALVLCSSRDPLDANNAFNAGTGLFRLDKEDEAIWFLRYALALAPESDKARKTLVTALRQTGHYAEALGRKQARFYAVRKGRCSDFSGTHFSRSGRLVA